MSTSAVMAPSSSTITSRFPRVTLPCSRRQLSEATVRASMPASFLEVAGGLAGGGSTEDPVAGGLEPGPDGLEGGRLAGAGHPDDQLEGSTANHDTNRDPALAVGERISRHGFGGGDGPPGAVLVNAGCRLIGEGVGEFLDARLVGEHAAGHPHVVAGDRQMREGDGIDMAENGVDSLVEDREGEAVEIGGDGDDHIGSAERVGPGQTTGRGEKFAGQVIQVRRVRPVVAAGGVNGGAQLGGWVPAGDQRLVRDPPPS
jgi:hypothetical protein